MIKKKSTIKRCAVLTALMLLCVWVLTGCSFLFDDLLEVRVSGIKFSEETAWTMSLGEEKELTASEVEVQPSLATDKSFTVSSDNGNIISVNTATNRIKAVGVGSANITVTSTDGSFTAQKGVTVTYAALSGVSITYDADAYVVADGKIVLTTDDLTAVALTVSIGANADPETSVAWTVTLDAAQVSAENKKGSETFTFAPTQVGAYTVTASCPGTAYADSLVVNVCAPVTDGAIEVKSGNLTQEEGAYTAVLFAVTYTNPDGNPDAVIEWLVNQKATGHFGETFSFIPSVAGAYEIEARINGVKISGKTVTAKGSIVPKNVTVDYDNCYPKVFIRWDEIPSKVGYSVSIVNNATDVELSPNINSNNTSLKDKFTSSGFDASDFMNGGGTSVFNTTFTVKVKTLGDGEAFTNSAWSNTATTKRLAEAAKPFLSKKYYGENRNFYITDNEEFYDWFSYFMLYRLNPPGEYGAVAENVDVVYMAYSYGDENTLISKAFDYSHFTGVYNLYGSAQYNLQTQTRLGSNQLSVKIVFFSDGAPTQKTGSAASPNIPNAWNAIRPHLNYDDGKARPNGYAFPIDSLSPVTVRTSDQLYSVAELGYRPVPESGSKAETLYAFARRLLLNIISKDMTDEEKAHAIYDWILWRVTYDSKVLNVKGKIDPEIDTGDTQEERQSYADTRAAVKYESYYLESVLTNTDFYSVCDGMSKAYSLLCNIEGIECLRITGTVPGGGHAWNKVKLDGNWYVVDCTWGDMGIAMMLKNKESASHAYFLLTDAEIAADHKEDSSYNYPRTTTKPYNWYDEDIDYKGGTVDFYFETQIGLEAEVKALSSYILESAQAAERYYAVGPDKKNVSNVVDGRYYGVDIRIESRIAAQFTYTSVNDNPMIRVMKTYFQKTLNSDYYLSYVDSSDENSVYLFVFFDLIKLQK